MTCILELNDSDLTLYRDDQVLHRSPGIAVVLDDEVQFGDDALRLSRVHPRQTNQQYFTRLNGDPLAVPGRRVRNHADLVYLHLQTFKPLIDAEGGEVLLAVPGILSPDQLGVLLGVLQEVGIGVSGFVDAAVASLAGREVPERAYYLDVMLQRAVVTTVAVNGELGKAGAQEVLECGLNRLLEGWINVIADRFVRETRFDPLHAAATEQQLFNQVYDWVRQGSRTAELAVEIVHGEHNRRVDVGRPLLEEKAEQRFRQLADAIPRGASVFLSERCAGLPGLSRSLDALQVEAVPLPADALPRGCLANLASIVPASGELRLVTRLPHAAAAVPAPATAPAGAVPTHALAGHEAWALDGSAAPLPVRRESGTWMVDPEPGLQVNGEQLASPHAAAAGDRITLGEQDYLLIRVREA